jgi:hypothetical protein
VATRDPRYGDKEEELKAASFDDLAARTRDGVTLDAMA